MYAWFDVVLQLFSFFAVALVTILFVQQVQRHLVVRQRLRAGGAPLAAPSVLRQTGVRSRFLNWVQASTSLNRPEERTKLAAELARAGYESPAAPAVYVASRYGLALGLPAALIIARSVSHAASGGLFGSMLPLFLCVVGLMLPGIWLRQGVSARRTGLEQQFPDALDLMVICMDAGLGLEAAVLRVGRDMQRSHPAIAREFERVAEELAAGRSRADALHGLAHRVDTPLIRGFVSLMVQSQALGASVVQGLKTYSVEMRSSRALKAEEKAMRIPVLMSVPLVACFLPVIVTALMLPATIDMLRILMPALHGVHGAHR